MKLAGDTQANRNPALEGAGDAVPSYLADLTSDVAVIALIEHIADLHREIGDIKRPAECPFIRVVLHHHPRAHLLRLEAHRA